jgi:isocitrate dehydrogenase
LPHTTCLYPGHSRPALLLNFYQLITRHAYGDQYMATNFVVPSAGKLTMKFQPADGGAPQVPACRPCLSPPHGPQSGRAIRPSRVTAHDNWSEPVLLSAVERTTPLLQDYEIFDFDGPGVAMGMYNTEHAIRGFALSCFEYALEKQWCES